MISIRVLVATVKFTDTGRRYSAGNPATTNPGIHHRHDCTPVSVMAAMIAVLLWGQWGMGIRKRGCLILSPGVSGGQGTAPFATRLQTRMWCDNFTGDSAGGLLPDRRRRRRRRCWRGALVKADTWVNIVATSGCGGWVLRLRGRSLGRLPRRAR